MRAQWRLVAAIENLGDDEIHNLIVELKAPAGPLAA
jgi:hypothetical protein